MRQFELASRVLAFVLAALFASPSCDMYDDTLDDNLGSGLVAHYQFDGHAVDLSGHAYSGTVVGAKPAENRIGKANSAYSFNGSSTYIRFGNILDEVFCTAIAKFSISGWASTRTWGSRSFGGGLMVGKAAGGTYGPYQWCISHVDGQIYGQVFFDTTENNYVTLKCPVGVNQWFHFALVFDGSQSELSRLRMYVNGQDFDVTPLSVVGTIGRTTTHSAQQMTVGGGHRANRPQEPNNLYNGNIDDVRIYNRPLTQAEVQALYFLKE